jgi:D-alanyl-D-alanine carboxypeptidase (penicillin-binding protein 5/6)
MSRFGSIADSLVRPFRGRLARAVAACVLGVTAALTGPFAAQAQSFQSAAPYAVLLDSASGTVLYEKAADELMAPASIAKVARAAASPAARPCSRSSTAG